MTSLAEEIALYKEPKNHDRRYLAGVWFEKNAAHLRAVKPVRPEGETLLSRALNTTVGLGAAAILTAYVPQFEGMILRGYKDPIGIVTACAGHTATAVLGKPYTTEECVELLDKDLSEHAEGAASCVPLNNLSTGKRAAAVSFAYNVGVSKFCQSTFAYKLRLNDPQACAELPRWVYAGGEVLPGLVKRRNVEKAICELPEFS